MPIVLLLAGCSHGRAGPGGESGARLKQEIVREAVVFEPGTKDGAVIPEISAPSLRAMIVEEKIEGNRLIEKHREWILEGDVQLLGIPKDTKEPHTRTREKTQGGGPHEN